MGVLIADDESIWTVICPRPLIVRADSALTSVLLDELAPGEEVTILKTGASDDLEGEHHSVLQMLAHSLF